MANIFERYGIKEVANVYFEALEAEDGTDIKAGDIVLYLDTLKVSTVETTAENVSAQGGWGNPKLITWDYGKDINVTLEDAVISWEEMRILMGAKFKEASSSAPLKIRKNAETVVDLEEVKTTSGDPVLTGYKFTYEKPISAGLTVKGEHVLPDTAVTEGHYIDRTNGIRGTYKITAPQQDGSTMTVELTPADITAVKVKSGVKIRLFWEDVTTDEAKNATELVITPNDFPGTYRVVGDALIRSEKNAKDEAFQFVINKAKLLSEVTLTMQAEGDPSTFNMTLNVLRDDNGDMMSLIKY